MPVDSNQLRLTSPDDDVLTLRLELDDDDDLGMSQNSHYHGFTQGLQVYLICLFITIDIHVFMSRPPVRQGSCVFPGH